MCFFLLLGSLLFNLTAGPFASPIHLSIDVWDGGRLGAAISPPEMPLKLSNTPSLFGSHRVSVCARSRRCWWQVRLQPSPNLFFLSRSPEVPPADRTYAWQRLARAALGLSRCQAQPGSSGASDRVLRGVDSLPAPPPRAHSSYPPGLSSSGCPWVPRAFLSEIEGERNKRRAGGG